MKECIVELLNEHRYDSLIYSISSEINKWNSTKPCLAIIGFVETFFLQRHFFFRLKTVIDRQHVYIFSFLQPAIFVLVHIGHQLIFPLLIYLSFFVVSHLVLINSEPAW